MVLSQAREIGPNERDLIGAGGLAVFDPDCHEAGVTIARLYGQVIVRVVLPDWLAGKYADLVIGGLMRNLARELYGVAAVQSWTRLILTISEIAPADAARITALLTCSAPPLEPPITAVGRWVPHAIDATD